MRKATKKQSANKLQLCGHGAELHLHGVFVLCHSAGRSIGLLSLLVVPPVSTVGIGVIIATAVALTHAFTVNCLLWLLQHKSLQ
jgi:hypothetical protein